MEQKFTVKFKGKLYDDAHYDKMDHIWFGGNEFEYCPPTSFRRESQVIIHGFKQNGPASFVHTSKVSTAKPAIVKDNGDIQKLK